MKLNQETTPIESANNNFKQSSRNRFLIAAILAIVCLALLILWGPSADQINKKFAFIGTPAEMQLVNAISIGDEKNKVNQLPESLQKPPPPAIQEPEEEDPQEDGTREIIKSDQEQFKDNPVTPEVSTQEAKEFKRELVSMATPMQNSRNYFFKHMEYPEYPLNATEAERQTEVIYVSVQFFVESDGVVSAAMIQNTNGGPAFTEEVLIKMKQWIIGFYIDPGPGMWMQTTWNFKSPFFSHSQNP